MVRTPAFARWSAALSVLLSVAVLAACQNPESLTAPGIPESIPVIDDTSSTTEPPPPKPAPAYQLVFDRWDLDGGNVVRPWLMQARITGDSVESTDSVRTVLDMAGAFDATVSVTGNLLVYTCTTGHGTTLCRAALDGTGARTMVTDFSAMNADQPALSPDGQQVAFRGWLPGGSVGLFNPAHIYVMNVDGTNLRRLAVGQAGKASLESPTWSPRQADGSYRVAFAQQTRSEAGYMVSQLMMVSEDGTGLTELTAADENLDTEPAWSPDGSRLAFIRRSGALAGDVFVLALADSAGQSLAQPEARALMANDPSGEQRSPAWSPDGSRLAFVSSHEILGTFYNWQVYSVAADGTRLARHTASPHEHANPVWVPR